MGLNGHPSYYPRHGYKACFGFGNVAIDVAKLPTPSQTLERWPVQREDLPWLQECQAREWADVDFAWLWGTTRSECVLPGTDTLVWKTREGRRAAFTMRRLNGSWEWVLADDVSLARDLIATIKPESLKQHPSGWLARNVIDPAWGRAEVKPSAAAMACELRPGVLGAYLKAVESSARLPGFINWPLPFAAC